MADARRLVASAAQGLDVGCGDGRFLLDDAALLLDTARLGVALHEVQPFDDDAVLLRDDAQDLAGLAALLAGDDEHGVVLAQSMDRHAHSTSGASEIIFMNRFARRSRATGPNLQVPMGSRALQTSTADLVTTRCYHPSD